MSASDCGAAQVNKPDDNGRSTTIKVGIHEFSVTFYDSVEDMRCSLLKNEWCDMDHSRTHSCVQPEIVYSSGSLDEIEANIGKIHLLRDLRTGVLCHEAVHAAVHLLKVLNGTDVIMIDDSMTVEEDFAMSVGLIAAEIRRAHLLLFPEDK